MGKKSYEFILKVVSQEATLEEMASFWEKDPPEGSYSRGDLRGAKTRKRASKYSVWVLSAYEFQGDGFDEALDEFKGFLERRGVRTDVELPDACKMMLDVGVVYEEFTCTVHVSDRNIDWMARNGISLSVSCYPGQAGSGSLI